MAKARGYQNYRGRTSKWKIAAAVVLVLVILVSAGVILLQRYVFYDDSGRPQMELPGKADEPMLPEEIELDIQEPAEPPAPKNGKTVQLGTASGPLTMAVLETARPGLAAGELAAVTLRTQGLVYFDSASALLDSVKTQPDTGAALAELEKAAPGTAALFGCFQDRLAAASDVEGMGLKNTGGYIFYDGGNRNWLDPSKEGTRAYLGRQLVEIAALGFDEIILTEFTFPTEGKLNKIAYPAEGRQESLNGFLKAMRTVLDEGGYPQVRLSVALNEADILAGGNDAAGVDLAALAGLADTVYARTTVEGVPALDEAVKAAGGTFVPILPVGTAVPEGQACLLTNG